MADKSQAIKKDLFAFASKVEPPDKPSLKDGSSAAKKKKPLRKSQKNGWGCLLKRIHFRKRLSPTGI